MQGKLWAVIFIAIILGSGLPMRGYAQENSYRIIKIASLRGGKAESVTRDLGNLLQIRDSRGRDRTPEEGVKVGDRVILDRYVHCGWGINVALQANNDEVFWMNSNTSVQVKDRYIEADEGEIYTSAQGLRMKLPHGTVVDLKGGEFYLKTEREETSLYLFKGRFNLAQHVLDKRTPFARISSEGVECLGSDELPDAIEQRAKMWRKSIRRLTPPFWRKPKFYVPTAAIAAALTTAVYYFTREQREQKAEVRIHVEMP